MISKIDGGVLPVVTLILEKGEEVFTESGGMTWMTDSFKMETNTKGGLLKGLGRMFSGESLFMSTYTCVTKKGKIAFASSFPGEILEFNLSCGKSIICQKRSFLCAESSINVSIYFNKRLGSGLFGGEGFIMQKLDGRGKAFIECDGSVEKIELNPGQRIVVNTGNVAAFEDTVHMDIQPVKGFKNMFFGGEGLFLTTLTGPGRVYLQSMTIQELAQKIIPYLPVQNNNN